LSFLNSELRGGIGPEAIIGDNKPAADGAAEGSFLEPLFGPSDGLQTLVECFFNGVIGLLGGEGLR
jgi:hypothetical protein